MKQLASIFGILGTALLLSVSASCASDLPACPPSGYFDNCFGSYTFADGSKQAGEWKNGELLSVSARSASDLPACPPSGYFDNCFGSYTWDDGAKYVGEWKDDKFHGV